MPAQIRPTRLDVTDRFPMVAFKIRADGSPSRAEVAIGVDPILFTAEGKKDRTAANFYSTRSNGGVRFVGGEAGFTLPPEVLARFIGNERLYFGLATAGDGGAMKVAVMPSRSSPYISIKGLSGRSMARVRVLPNRQQRAAGYGSNSQAQLEWAGDTAQPGMAPVTNGADAAAKNGKANGASPQVAEPYDDGFGPMPGEAPAQAAPAAGPAAQGLGRRQARGFDYADDPESRGIEGPAYSETAPLPSGQARMLSVPTPDYPRASRFVASPAFNTGRSGQTIDRIVIHITDAPTTTSTVNHFTAPGAQASAHYLVGQDGEVVQFVAEANTAWHARGVNSRSIGIEHVAIKVGGVDYPRRDGTMQHFDHLPPTDTQYCESAALVTYLCDKYGLTADRTTIIGHREADPRTSHSACPDGAWNWDHFMDLVTNRHCAPQPATGTAQGLSLRARPKPVSRGGAAEIIEPFSERFNAQAVREEFGLNDVAHSLGTSRAMSAGAFTVNWDEVELIPQPNNFTCWAAAGAMLIGWRDRVSLTPETVGQICSRSTASGLNPGDVERFAGELGLIAEPPVSYSIDGFRSLLESSGPLWVAEALPNSLHAIIVTGMYSDGVNTFVRIADPWDRAVGTPGAPGNYASTHTTGSRYIMRYEDFHAQYEAAINGNPPNRQILHSGNPNALVANTGQTVPPPGYAQSYAQGSRLARARGLSGDQSFTINWDEVQQIAQPTNVSCWATAASMVLGWRDRMSLTVEGIAEQAGLTTATGLDPAAVGQFAIDMGMTAEPPQSYTIEAFRDMLAQNGPLWVGAAVPSLHAIVVTGLYNDGSGTFVRVTDPWDRDVGAPGSPGAYANTHATGSRYILRWADFVAEYERAATDYSRVNLQILHCGGTHGHTANTGQGTPPGYAMGLGRNGQIRMPSPPPARAGAQGVPDMIGGTVIETERGSVGDVTWELDQYRGIKHPNDVAPPIPGSLLSAPTIRLDRWPVSGSVTEAVSAWFSIDWQYDGTSLGNVRIGNIGAQNAAGWALAVRARIMDERMIHQPGSCAALRVQLRYQFSTAGAADRMAITDVCLYGDGTHEVSSRWEQATVAHGSSAARTLDAATVARAVVAKVGEIVAGAVTQHEGGVSWSLDAFNGVKHPNDVAPSPSPPLRDATPITLGRQSRGWVDKIGADFQVDWQYNGTSVGNIRVTNIWRNDALLANLDVRCTIAHDNAVYDHRTDLIDVLPDADTLLLIPGFSQADNTADRKPCAAMRVTFDMTWDEQFSGTSKIRVDIHLFGDGLYSHRTVKVQ